MKRGFTLSEVLITLGIVGVVAVLTVPSVMKNYRNRMYVAQLQKVYAQISDAAQAIMRDENVDNFFETTVITETIEEADYDASTGKGKSGYAKFLSDYFKVNKYNCADSNVKNPCVPLGKVSGKDVYRTIAGTDLGGLESAYCVQTVNGASICAAVWPMEFIMILVDVNGISGPNIAGRDLFVMSVKADGTVADGVFLKDNTNIYEGIDCNEMDSIDSAAAGCLNAIIDAGWKMEY